MGVGFRSGSGRECWVFWKAWTVGVPGTLELSAEDSQSVSLHRRERKERQTTHRSVDHYPSSSNPSIAGITRPYSSVRQGRTSKSALTWSACIARNKGSVSVNCSTKGKGTRHLWIRFSHRWSTCPGTKSTLPVRGWSG